MCCWLSKNLGHCKTLSKRSIYLLSEELAAFLATSYCSGSALAVLHRKNLEDSELSLEMSGMLMVWNISGPRSPANHFAVVCSSCTEGKQRLSPQAAVPCFPTKYNYCQKRESQLSCHLQLRAPTLLSYAHPRVLPRELVWSKPNNFISLTCLATSPGEW